MKKIISIFLTVCMLGTAGITTVLANDFSKTQGEFIRVSDTNELIPIEIDNTNIISIDEALNTEDIAEIEPIELENEEDINAQASGIGTAYVQGEYIQLFPVVEENGEYKYYPYCYQFGASQGNTYVSGTATEEIQNRLIATANEDGYETFGWYMVGSIHLEVDKPDRFTFNIYPKENDKLYSTNAQNGSNVFGFMTLYPTDTTASYSLGMRGHVYYTTMYPNAPVSGQKSTCLLVYFPEK